MKRAIFLKSTIIASLMCVHIGCSDSSYDVKLKAKAINKTEQPKNEVPPLLPDDLWSEIENDVGKGNADDVIIFQGQYRASGQSGIFAINSKEILEDNETTYYELENPAWNSYFKCLEQRDQRSQDQRKISYIKTIDQNLDLMPGYRGKIFMTALHLLDLEFGQNLRLSGHNPNNNVNLFNYTNPSYPLVHDFQPAYSPTDHFVAWVTTEDANKSLARN